MDKMLSRNMRERMYDLKFRWHIKQLKNEPRRKSVGCVLRDPWNPNSQLRCITGVKSTHRSRAARAYRAIHLFPI